MALRLMSSLTRVARMGIACRSLSMSHSIWVVKPVPLKNLEMHTRMSAFREFSSCFPEIATYDEIKGLPYRPETILIDVREPQEVQDTGAVPTSINIPLGQVAEKLAKEFSEDEFFKLFNRKKPTETTEIIFMCKIGRRSHNALEIARQLGYKNGRNYLGSWQEWSNKEGLNK